MFRWNAESLMKNCMVRKIESVQKMHAKNHPSHKFSNKWVTSKHVWCATEGNCCHQIPGTCNCYFLIGICFSLWGVLYVFNALNI